MDTHSHHKSTTVWAWSISVASKLSMKLATYNLGRSWTPDGVDANNNRFLMKSSYTFNGRRIK